MSATQRSFRVGAFLVGVAAVLAATFALVVPLGAALGGLLALRGASLTEIRSGIEAWMRVPPGLVLAWGIGSLATMLGAWVAAGMAPRAPLRHAAAVGLASVVLDLVSLGYASALDPLVTTGLVLTFALAVLGGTFVAPPPLPVPAPGLHAERPPAGSDRTGGAEARRQAAVGAGAAIAASLLFAGMHLTTVAYVGPWLPPVAVPAQAEVPEPLDVEAILHAQSGRVASRLAALAPPRPGVPDLYLVAFGADATQSVFLSEVERVQALFDTRFDTAGRSLVLANHRDALERHPLASGSNLRDVLHHLGERLDPEEDVLFLFLTGHGRRDPHELVVHFPSLPLNPLRPEELAGMLEEAGVGPRVVVVSACYSGGFVEPLTAQDALVATAAAADRRSFGCRDGAEWTDYGRALFADALPTTFSFPEAFEEARGLVEVREAEAERRASMPQVVAGETVLARLEALRARWVAWARSSGRADEVGRVGASGPR